MKVIFVSGIAARLRARRRRARAFWLQLRGRREDVVVELARSIPGMFRRDEIPLLYRTARDAPGPGDYAEIGSWKGRTTLIQALGMRDGHASGAKLYAIDHHAQGDDPEGLYLQARLAREGGSSLDELRANLKRFGVEDIVEPVVMRSQHAASLLADRGVRLRMLFIDGAHDEESVRGDIRGFVPLVNPGGIVAFHDCVGQGWVGVWKAYESELADRVEEIGRAGSLLVVRLLADPVTRDP